MPSGSGLELGLVVEFVPVGTYSPETSFSKKSFKVFF